MPHDSRALTDCVEFFDPLTLEQQQKARKTVCAFATDADDAAELLKMLGIYPGQEADDFLATSALVPATSLKGAGV